MPRMFIHLDKLAYNAAVLARRCHDQGISAAVVTKGFCADPHMVEVLENSPVDYLADSRLENFRRYPSHNKPRILLRLPEISRASEVVELCEISLNSQQETLLALNQAACAAGKTHGVILMVDVGDLREGIYYDQPEKIWKTIEFILSLPSLSFMGMGLNLTCYGSIIPTRENIGRLCGLAKEAEKRYDISIPILSGGNSSSLHLLYDGQLPEEITNLRLGEAVLRGYESAYHQRLQDLQTDAIQLEAEIIERQYKPSYPDGEVGYNAFGERETFTNIGRRMRAILAVGRQDTEPSGLSCLTPGVTVVGASSDHMIVDVTEAQGCQVGDVLRFSMSYGAILRGFTSQYVERIYL